jgi:hypothetical protein
MQYPVEILNHAADIFRMVGHVLGQRLLLRLGLVVSLVRGIRKGDLPPCGSVGPRLIPTCFWHSNADGKTTRLCRRICVRKCSLTPNPRVTCAMIG